MSKRSIKVLLSDILTAINNITFYVEGYDKQKFLSDRKTIDSVLSLKLSHTLLPRRNVTLFILVFFPRIISIRLFFYLN